MDKYSKEKGTASETHSEGGKREIGRRIEEVIKKVEEIKIEKRWDEWMQEAKKIKGLIEGTRGVLKEMGMKRIKKEIFWKTFKREIAEKYGIEETAVKQEKRLIQKIQEIEEERSIEIRDREERIKHLEEKIKKLEEENKKIEEIEKRNSRIERLEESFAEIKRKEKEKEERIKMFKEDLRNSPRCYNCNKPGHLSKNCWGIREAPQYTNRYNSHGSVSSKPYLHGEYSSTNRQTDREINERPRSYINSKIDKDGYINSRIDKDGYINNRIDKDGYISKDLLPNEYDYFN